MTKTSCIRPLIAFFPDPAFSKKRVLRLLDLVLQNYSQLCAESDPLVLWNGVEVLHAPPYGRQLLGMSDIE